MRRRIMVHSPPLEDRLQTPQEERANCASHAVGLALALAGAPFLIEAASRTGDAGKIVGASIFAATMVLLYLTSTLYHALSAGRAKRALQVMDHAAIFLFIAGSYSPLTLGALRGPWGWSLFGVVWALAAAGVLLKLTCGVRHPRLSMLLYLAMGWLSLVAIYPLWTRLSPGGFLWLLAGGVAYTGGVTYFLNDHRTHFHHFRWHLFVLTGSLCHFVAVLAYAL